MVIAGAAQSGVALPPVGVHGRAGCDGRSDERGQRVAGGVGQNLQPQPSRASAASLDGDPDDRLAVALAAAAPPGMATSDKGFVDFDRAA